MKKFNMDNTEGYTQEQLNEMNNRYENETENLDENDVNYENECKNISDRVQTKYDTESTRYHIDATYEIDYLDGSEKVGGCQMEDGYKNVFDVNNAYCLEVENILNNDDGVIKYSA